MREIYLTEFGKAGRISLVKQIIRLYFFVQRSKDFAEFVFKSKKIVELNIKEMKTKRLKKQSRLIKVRLLPQYWKVIISLVLIFGGGSFGMSLFMGADDFEMILGFVLLAVLLWLLIQIWLPAPTENKEN